MAIESRGNGRYYYRKRRIGRRVLSEYIGGGVYAELAAKLDDNDRHKKAQAMAAFRQQCDEQDTTDREIDELCEFVQATTDAMLLITGHHHHKRQWRKQRDHRKSIAAGV